MRKQPLLACLTTGLEIATRAAGGGSAARENRQHRGPGSEPQHTSESDIPPDRGEETE